MNKIKLRSRKKNMPIEKQAEMWEKRELVIDFLVSTLNTDALQDEVVKLLTGKGEDKFFHSAMGIKKLGTMSFRYYAFGVYIGMKIKDGTIHRDYRDFLKNKFGMADFELPDDSRDLL